MKLFSCLFLLILLEAARAQIGSTEWTTYPFNAPSFPIAVKAPYMNAWEPQGNVTSPMSDSFPKIGSTFFSVSTVVAVRHISISACILNAIAYRTWDGTA